MAGERLLDALGYMAMDADGDRILVPAGGMDLVDACCCLEEPPDCDCRRMYTGLNTIFQQDQWLQVSEYELHSLYDPIFASGFTSNSNSVDTDDNPGAHRCWEMVGCGTGGVIDEEEAEPYPRYHDLCISCTDPAAPTTLSRPCGWVMGQTLSDACFELDDELMGPTWYWVGRNLFKPIDLNHCISSSIAAGTLTESGAGGTDGCGVYVPRWCPAPGNQLKVTLTVGAQSLVVWGRWIDQNTVQGFWFFIDTDPSNIGIAFASLPYHRGTVVGKFQLVCNGDDTVTFTFNPNRAPPPVAGDCPPCWGGLYSWVNGDDIAFHVLEWTWAVTDTSHTINESINPETPLGGDGDPMVPLTILVEWITVT